MDASPRTSEQCTSKLEPRISYGYDWIMWAVVVLVIVIVIGWWALGAYNFVQPFPSRPDANYAELTESFESYPTELWFRNKSCIFEEYLSGSTYRYVVLESDGRVVWSSSDDSNLIEPKRIPLSVEYQKASVTLEGAVKRGKTTNLCRAVKEGTMYRMVHVSSYRFDEDDDGY